MGSVRWDPLRALQLQDLPGASQCGREGGGRGRLGEQWKCRAPAVAATSAQALLGARPWAGCVGT